MKRFLRKIRNIFKRVDNLREMIEDKIADVLDKASKSQILDYGQELMLYAAIDAVESYVKGKIQKQAPEKLEAAIDDFEIPADVKKQIVAGMVSGHNKLQRKIAEQLRK